MVLNLWDKSRRATCIPSKCHHPSAPIRGLPVCIVTLIPPFPRPPPAPPTPELPRDRQGYCSPWQECGAAGLGSHMRV
ncbi:hypothetical protein E2C01_014386 [Portunus trituberculatus]|uniref:Uncharacterized protein n=1 Tax=Portunus trituberculatus TaxID=210409 RepID=A0A5B7DJ12_PORTR|nr:hypothetical protein [Portunus trituberculatus]